MTVATDRKSDSRGGGALATGGVTSALGAGGAVSDGDTPPTPTDIALGATREGRAGEAESESDGVRGGAGAITGDATPAGAPSNIKWFAKISICLASARAPSSGADAPPDVDTTVASRSLVFMELTRVDVFEHADGVIGENGGRAVERN
jgi:hypothetical protein